jgi:hypothetical protein
MSGPVPPVVDGLQIDQALDFQRRFERVQRVAWWVLGLVPVAAIAGLFGGGLFSQTTGGGGAAGLTVTYERFGRLSAETEIELTLARPAGPVDVAISRGFLDRYDVIEVRPEPVGMQQRPDRVSCTGSRPAAGRRSRSSPTMWA